MSWQNFPSFLPSTAVALGQDLYEVIITDWSRPLVAPNEFVNRVWPPPINGVVQPGLESSLAAIAIGPRSTVDRSLLSYNLQSPKVTDVEQVGNDRLRRFSVDAPLYFTQAANPGVRPDLGISPQSNQTNTQTLSVWSGSTGGPHQGAELVVDGIWFPTEYYKTDGTLVLVDPDTALFSFETPTLHLYLYLKPPVSTPPPSRTPMFRKGSPFGPLVVAPMVETLVAMIPVYGRRTIEINMSMNVPATYRIGSVRAFAPLFYKNQESTEVPTSGVIAADVAANFRINGANADYLMVYMTPQALHVSGTNRGQYTLVAYDHGGGSNAVIL